MSRVPRAVNKLDIETGKVIKTYDKIMDAAADNYCYGGSISKACRGILRNVSGYRWDYAERSDFDE